MLLRGTHVHARAIHHLESGVDGPAKSAGRSSGVGMRGRKSGAENFRIPASGWFAIAGWQFAQNGDANA